MYHSVRFDDRDTWDDWHLIPTTRPVFAPPPVKFKYADIPGSDGDLDLTTVLTEYPGLGNRTGSFEFIVANDYLSWVEAYASIAAYIHGKDMRAVLEDNPEFFYSGRFTINQWRSDKNSSLIVIDYDVAPFKTEIFGSDNAWLWDPFDFEFGEIQYYSNLIVVGSLTVTIESTDSANETWEWDPFDFEFGAIQSYSDVGVTRPIIPAFTVSGSISVTFEGITYPLPAGVSRIPEIMMVTGSNEFIFAGNGVVSIEYGRRSL